MTDSQGEFSWKPPKGATEISFQANDSTKGATVIIHGAGHPLPLTPFGAAPGQAISLEGTNGEIIKGTIVREEPFQFSLLPEEENFFQKIEEVDSDFAPSAQFKALMEQKLRNSPDPDKPHKNPLEWIAKLFKHKRHRGGHRHRANF